MRKPFDQAVTEHGPTVLRVCRAVLGGGPDADDAWQDTFLAALRAWPDLADDANVQAWLVTIAHRKAIDITRARARRPVPLGDLPEAGVEQPDDHSDLWSAVAALPTQQRLAVASHYFGGLPHVRTAELIGSSPEAVRRAASDGLRSLRSTIAREDL